MNIIDRIKALFVPSVDSALSSLQRTVNRLDAARDRLRSEAVRKDALARDYAAQAEAHDDEAYRADDIRNRIAALFR